MKDANLPQNWKIVQFKDIFEIRKGKKVNISENPSENSIPYVVIENLRGNPIKNFTDDEKGLLCDSDDILIVWDGANCGTVGSGLSGFVGSTIARLSLTDESIDKNYILIFLKSKFKIFNTHTTGATIPHLDKNFLINFKIPVPPRETQKKIVEILEKAEKLKEWRVEADELVDEYLKSVFLEMFGDPVKNSKGWDLFKFRDVGKLERGKSKHRPRNAPELLGGPYPLIQTGEVASSGGYIKTYTQTYSEIGLKQSRMWPKGTLCITIAANIAKTGILTFDACFPDSIVGFTPNKHVKVEYIQHWISFLQKILEDRAPESAQKNINLKILSNLEIPIPPLGLQEKFVEISEKLNQLKTCQYQSKQEIENLFNTLMQKAFKGELVC